MKPFCKTDDNRCCDTPVIEVHEDGAHSCSNCGSFLGYEVVHFVHFVHEVFCREATYRHKRKKYDRYDYVRILLNKFKTMSELPKDMSEEEREKLKAKKVEKRDLDVL